MPVDTGIPKPAHDPVNPTPGALQRGTGASTGAASSRQRPVPVPLIDNWQHRAQNMRCDTCMWWVPKVTPLLDPMAEAPRTKLGRCRHHSPTMKGFPATFPDDWCGDHKLDEARA